MMGYTKNMILYMLCLSSMVRFALSQYGPGDCLINRLDVVPCEFRSKKLVKPGIDEQGIYNTFFRSGSAGSPICRVRNPGHIVQNIVTLGNEGRVKLIFSPGFLTFSQIQYGNQQLVLYNISCQPGQLSYFDLMDIDMEEANCMDPNLGRERCRDYVFVDQSPFGNFEHCGRNVSTVPQSSALQLSNLLVMFRTSRADRFAGFRASVVCFSPQDTDMEGCTPGASGMPSTPEQAGLRRRKRDAEIKDLEEFHNQWKRKLAAIKRRNKRQDSNDIFFRFIEINVPFEVNVMYDQQTLKFVDSENNQPLRPTPENNDLRLTDVNNVVFLHTFDAEGKVDSFRNSFSSTTPIPGPGPMFIVGRHAYFQLFIIDPRGILPSVEEAAAITNITSAQFGIVQEEPLSEAFLNPPTVDPISIGLPPPDLRKKRQASKTDGRAHYPSRKKRQTINAMANDTVFSDDDIILALMNENACNAALRSSARATIEFVESFNRGRVDMLRASLSPTETPTSEGMTETTEDPLTPEETTEEPQSTEEITTEDVTTGSGGPAGGFV